MTAVVKFPQDTCCEARRIGAEMCGAVPSGGRGEAIGVGWGESSTACRRGLRRGAVSRPFLAADLLRALQDRAPGTVTLTILY